MDTPPDATAQTLALIITAIGGPALILSFSRSMFKWWTGRSGRERARNKTIVDSLRACEARADHEAALKRKALEYASKLIRQLNEAGITPVVWLSDEEDDRSTRDGPK